MSVPASDDRVPYAVLIQYAMPATALGFMGGLISIQLLKFSTDVLHIAPAVVGLIFGLSRVWDAVSDPLAGYWSDRTRSRLGRRRPWMIGAAIPLGAIFFALWSPPASLSANALAVWMGAGVLLFFTAQTLIAIPHVALGAELTLDYHDRSRVFASRLIFDFLGIILAAGSLVILERAADPRSAATSIALVAGVASTALILRSAGVLRERPEFQGKGAAGSLGALRDVVSNRYARLLIAVFFLDQLAFTSLITLLPYANQYVLHIEGMTGVFVAAAIGAALLVFPAWIPLSRRFGKRNPWIAAELVKAVGFGGLMWVQPGGWPLIVGLVIAIGAVQGAGGILGPSIKADVIDVDELNTGERKEGAYFAGWNLATKTGGAMAVAFAGFALQASGFVPNAEQTDQTLLAMRLLFAGFPALLSAAAALLLLRFDLDEQEHRRVRRALASQECSAPAR